MKVSPREARFEAMELNNGTPRSQTPRRCLTMLVGAVLLQQSLAWSQALPVASPESVGMSSQRLEKITTAMQDRKSTRLNSSH